MPDKVKVLLEFKVLPDTTLSPVTVPALPVILVTVTAPVILFTEVTADVGERSSCQLLRVDAPAVWRINVLLRSVRTARSPTSQVRTNIAAWLAQTNVSVIAIDGS